MYSWVAAIVNDFDCRRYFFLSQLEGKEGHVGLDAMERNRKRSLVNGRGNSGGGGSGGVGGDGG